MPLFCGLWTALLLCLLGKEPALGPHKGGGGPSQRYRAMSNIKPELTAWLDNISCGAIAEHLDAYGVETCTDLLLLDEEDITRLVGFLKKVQVKKVRAFRLARPQLC